MKNKNLVLVIPEIAGKRIALVKTLNGTQDVDICEMTGNGEPLIYLTSIHFDEFASACIDQNMDLLSTLFKTIEEYLKQNMNE